jgi:hypothetical protein
MRTIQNVQTMSKLRRAALGTIGAGALIVTAACGTNGEYASVRAAGNDGIAQQVANAPATGQVLVNCEPHQRTLVRQAVVNGQPVAQVECVAAEAPAYGAAPVGYVPAQRALTAHDYGYDTRVVQPAPVYREAQPRVVRTTTQPRVVTERAPQGRTVKKSAIIIGSSAGVGAGVGAAVGGKKGALIGAAVGGGSAAIWDQVTRDKK